MRRTTAYLNFTLILRTTAYNFQVKSSNLIRSRSRPKRSGPLTLQGSWIRSAEKGSILTPDPLLCCSASTPAQLYPLNCVDNFPASRLTSTFIWNVKAQTSEFCASVADTGSEIESIRDLSTTNLPTATTSLHLYNPNNVNKTSNNYYVDNDYCIYRWWTSTYEMPDNVVLYI